MYMYPQPYTMKYSVFPGKRVKSLIGKSVQLKDTACLLSDNASKIAKVCPISPDRVRGHLCSVKR